MAAAAAATGLLAAPAAFAIASLRGPESRFNLPYLQWNSPVETRRCASLVVQSRYGAQREARDRELDFGKFKGSLLGTMSSKYLKWMVKNLGSGPMSHWVQYAEEVLEDPYYKDRLEWEKVEKLMTMAHDIDSITGNRDVLAPAKAFGWNLEDDSGWRKVNFALLGTTQGGRIPRVVKALTPVAPVEKKKRVRKQSVTIRTQPPSLMTPDSTSQGSLREELMKRREARRDRLMANRGLKAAALEEEANRVMNPFPGRESLVTKVRSYDISD